MVYCNPLLRCDYIDRTEKSTLNIAFLFCKPQLPSMIQAPQIFDIKNNKQEGKTSTGEE